MSPQTSLKEKPAGRLWLRFIMRILPFAAAAFCAILLWIAPSYPALIDRYYSRGIYPVFAQILGGVTSLVPISICEAVICLLLIGALFMFCFAVCRGISSYQKRKKTLPAQDCDGTSAIPVPPEKKRTAKRVILLLSQILCAILIAYTLLCGLNYHRPTFAAMSGLEVRDSSAQELAALCRELAQQANRQAALVTRDESGVMQLSSNIWQTMRQGRETFGGLSGEYDFLPDWNILPKPILASRAMSIVQLTGVFCPYSFEANINIEAPPYNIPSTICHELAHTRGFMREDEANFIAYLACRESAYADFQYSGTMLALVHSMNKLYSADRQLHREISAILSDAVQRDFQYNNAYWDAFETPVAEVATAVNNAYLQVNNQQDGVQSYGRMTDLLLADYRARHEET